ncbi:MAG: ATP-binding protein [Peptococcales bacterium]|jgi:hypothetical protein
MRDLSLHILDIVQNSVAANATKIEIWIKEDMANDLLEITIKDNGKGMSQDELTKVIDPFYTSRTTRKVGLGIPLFKANAELCDGKFQIDSRLGIGTEVFASFQHSHIDRVPLGDIIGTIISILAVNPETELLLKIDSDGHLFTFDTEEIKVTLEDVPINTPLVLDWIKLYLTENIVLRG